VAGGAAGARVEVVSATALSRPRSAALIGSGSALAPLAAVSVSAALYGLAFAPLPGAGAVAWIALAPFFGAAASAPPRRAALLGLAFGCAGGLATCWWLPGTLERYFGLGTVASWLAAGGSFALFAGLHCALFAAWLAALARRGPVPAALVGLGWSACEWLRACVGIPNPWALSAYSQIDLRPLAQLADLAGPWGLGALLAAANALVAGAFVPALRPARPLRAAAVFVALAAAALGYGAWQLARDPADGPALRVVLVQGGSARRGALPPAASRADLERALAATAEAAAAERPDLVVWPEGAVDFSPLAATQRSLRLRDFSRGLDADLLLGAPRRPRRGLPRNSMLLLRHGQLRSLQDKLELMPFSERNPFPGLFPSFGDAYAPGDAIRLFEVGGVRLGTAICSEAMGPDFSRRLVDAGATLLANPSNDVWLASPGAAWQQLAKARFRAIETRRFVLRAATTGHSAIIDPHGDLAAALDFGRAGWIAGLVRASGERTLHQRVGGVLGPAALAGCAAASALFRRRRPHAAGPQQEGR
jgi:apolipoprotein N-acyltransferase